MAPPGGRQEAGWILLAITRHFQVISTHLQTSMQTNNSSNKIKIDTKGSHNTIRRKKEKTHLSLILRVQTKNKKRLSARITRLREYILKQA